MNPRPTTLALLALLGASAAQAYPLDAAEATGIRRLIGRRIRQQSPTGKKLAPGALLGVDEVRLRVTENPDADLLDIPQDPALRAALVEMLAKRDPSYSMVVVDITDPKNIAWAGLREETKQIPGSVGKFAVMLGFFDALARAFPALEDRQRLLKEHVVVADSFAVGDSHEVPIYDAAAKKNWVRPVRAGDSFTLAEWVDHAIAASANSAGSVVWKEAMLLRHFGDRYPVAPEEQARFWDSTGGARLATLALKVIEDPMRAAGLRPEFFRQGTMFTGGGQRRVPGTSSYAAPIELARALLRLEQGRLVDAWSSLEMKRFLYTTSKRYRYVFAPELAGSAVFFKSGSLYGCRPEPGFTCGKYMGNRMNMMNSIAIVESPARGPDSRRYLVALMSNVLKVNSAWDHSRIGAAVDRAVRVREAVAIQDQGSTDLRNDAGKADHE